MCKRVLERSDLNYYLPDDRPGRPGVSSASLGTVGLVPYGPYD